MAQKFNPDELEQKIAAKLTMEALHGDGSSAAARQVLDILDRIRSREAAERHRQQMEALAERPVEMARYLGYLGEGPGEIEEALGRVLAVEEREAREEGKKRRQLELRAVELEGAARGRVKPAAWMRR